MARLHARWSSACAWYTACPATSMARRGDLQPRKAAALTLELHCSRRRDAGQENLLEHASAQLAVLAAATVVAAAPVPRRRASCWQATHSRTPGTALRRASGMGASHSSQWVRPGPWRSWLRARLIASSTVASIWSWTAPSPAQPVAMAMPPMPVSPEHRHRPRPGAASHRGLNARGRSAECFSAALTRPGRRAPGTARSTHRPRRCRRRARSLEPAVVEHDQARVALTHLVGGRARQQRVAIAVAHDHQRARGQLPAHARHRPAGCGWRRRR